MIGDPVAQTVTVKLEAKPGDTKDGKRVLAVTIDDSGTVKYKLSDKHTLGLVGEDKREATFRCSYCNRAIAFALPGLGEPAAVGGPGAWEPPAEFMRWMDLCSIS